MSTAIVRKNKPIQVKGQPVEWAVVHRPVNWFGVFVNESTLNTEKLKQCKMFKTDDGIDIYNPKVEGYHLWVPTPNISHALIANPVESKEE